MREILQASAANQHPNRQFKRKTHLIVNQVATPSLPERCLPDKRPARANDRRGGH